MYSIQLMLEGGTGVTIPGTPTTEEELDSMMKDGGTELILRGRGESGEKITVHMLKSCIKGTIHVESFKNVALAAAPAPGNKRVQ